MRLYYVLGTMLYGNTDLNRTLSAPSWSLGTRRKGHTINQCHPKGNQLWIFIGRTDAEAEAPILWPTDPKSQLIRKDLDAGKDWEQEEKRATEDEIVEWHHQLNGHMFEQSWGDMKDREAWHAAVRGVTQSQTWLSDWTTTIS